MKKQLIFAALAATTLLAACGKEGGNNPVDKGAEAKMGLTISFPETAATRAADTNASADDVAVNSISVFIFNADGTPATGHNTVNKSMFTAGTNNTWTLNNANLISTSVGEKHVYVGINLPSALSNAAIESVLTEAASASGLTQSSPFGISMLGFSDGVTPSTTSTVVASVNVARLMSKVAVTFSTNTTEWTPAGQNYAVAVDQFSVGNTAKTFFPKQKTASNKLVTPGPANTSKASNLDGVQTAQLAVNASTVNNNAKVVKYVQEHTPSSLQLRNESTYAVVRGELKPAKLSKAESGNIVEYNAPAPATENIYAFIYQGKVRFTTAANRTALLTLCGITNAATNYDEYVLIAGKYYTFYHVYLNKERTADPLAVWRNQFIDVKVRSVRGIGTPGNPTTPTNPPTTPDDSTDPVIEVTANLDVDVNVDAWDYVPAVTDLL